MAVIKIAYTAFEKFRYEKFGIDSAVEITVAIRANLRLFDVSQTTYEKSQLSFEIFHSELAGFPSINVTPL
jgi:hypothetical protein|tara:strand:+ start:187 stop:399 length:213 start_codon:yes stop_codon:yes gene_type:complete